MKRLTKNLIAFSVALLSNLPMSYACTDFRLIAKDNTVLVTRSLEFAMDLKSHLRSSTRGRQFMPITPNGTPAMSWRAQYGYLYLDGLDQDFAIDGMNEMGLSFEYLYLPGETQYQAIPVGKEKQAIPYLQLGDWVLGNFKTVEEVRQALANVYIYQQTIPALGSTVFPLHAAIYDATGKSIVVEFIQGKMNIFNNDIGVLTNSPSYDWQITNLRNYLNLTPYSPSPITLNGITFSATGQGAGMVGLPGDISPPSRFAKMSFMLKVAYLPNNAIETVNLAQHMINNVDIPYGLSRAMVSGKETTESTQWVVFKDLTHKTFYYRTYNDMTLRSVNMDKVDFAPGAMRLSMPLASNPYMLDMTESFRSAKVG